MATSKKQAQAGDKRGRGGQALYAVVGEKLIEDLDAWVDRLNEKSAGPKWTRQDVVKAALARAVRERGEAGKDP